MSGIIRLEPAHALVAGALHRTSFAAPWRDEEFAKLLEQPGVAGLMWTGAEPQGFILIRAVADEAEILTLAVAPDFRRRGIAESLLEEAARMLRAGGTHRLFLEVADDNTAARALYEKRGFTATGRRAKYYERGAAPRVDAVIMALALQPPTLAAPHH
ncbi:MAG: ribosomal protein S18-alanine N-acetyltransferase [Rhodospirillaceae bacterium]|nr:ribosomal protein S18-alanine N-acetyltransferase [Rhodospirillaceae bacterium]